MDPKRLQEQLTFVLEIDALCNVIRRSYLADGSRLENTAEHSWQLAMMAVVLAEYAWDGVDLLRAIKMALVHDIVEIDAGDTYAYGATGHDEKDELEQRAARRLFGLLPRDQASELSSLWEEFEAGETADARFVRALDRLSPLMLNHASGGRSWRENEVRRSQVEARMAEIEHNAPALWPHVNALIEDGVAQGWLQPV